VKNYYGIGLATDIDFTPTRGETANSALSMIYRGMTRGENHRNLYKSGIVGMDLIANPWEQGMDVVGKVNLLDKPMDSITNLLVDIAHLLLMIGGLYLLAGAIWGGPPGRR
jgi:hypothetical protein